MTPPAAPSVRYAPRVAPPGLLDGRAWPYSTGRFAALHHDFRVRTNMPGLTAFLDRVFRDLAAPGAATHTYSLVDRGTSAAKGRYALYYDDERIALAGQPPRAVSMVLWHVNHSVVKSSGPHFVCLHAAGAEYDGTGIVLPAPMESGKTTLVAGLVRAGARYFTDEMVAFDPTTLLIHPFPKALSIDPGSWPVLPDLRVDGEEFSPRQWQVPVTTIRSDALATPVRATLVVAPRYEAGAETVLTPVSRGRMALTMVESTFDFGLHARRNLDVLAAVLGGATCYNLVVGDLDTACDLVLGLAAEPRAAEVAG